MQVAETRERQRADHESSRRDAAAVVIPAAGGAAGVAGAGAGIQPLNQLEQRIRAHPVDDLALDDRTVPLEVAPLVSSVNDLLTRLNESLATQNAFWPTPPWLQNAAGDLRMQADLAQRRAPARKSSSARCGTSDAPASVPRTP